MKKKIKKIVFIFLILLVALAACSYLWLQQPKFGKPPEGSRLEQMQQSPHYSEGVFHNVAPIPPIKSKGGFAGALIEYLFASKEGRRPPAPIPVIKTDLKALDKNRDLVIWFGHSSCYIQLDGKRILLDPVFSDSAAPVSFANKAFPGTNLYTAEEMPEIDYLLISHDHWDHLDYPTVKALRGKVRTVICPLGVGAYFEQWGFDGKKILEGDWFTELKPDKDFSVHILPARHFSGRLMARNRTLWAGFALVTQKRKIFISGDSGYGPHFAEIGKRFKGFDLAILDCGQYDKKWRFVHMMPEDAVMATEDLGAKALLPAHVGRFSIAYHSWNDPFIRISAASAGKDFRLLTPKIGELLDLENENQSFGKWWEGLR